MSANRTRISAERFEDDSAQPSNLIQLLRAKALSAPERLAYTFLNDGETEEADLTYGELDRQARVIAARLQGLEMQGQRVLLLYPPGLEYVAAFWGCLYAGAVAVPAYPPRMNHNLLRLQAIVADAEATAALTTAAILSRLKTMLARDASLGSLRWLTTEDLGEVNAGAWSMPEVRSNALAFLQYTSGSTATPKGVVVTHANVLHNQALIKRAFRQSRRSVIVGWLPLYHDMGLIGNLLQPLYLGARCILMSPLAFLQRPARWLQAISRFRATTSGGPNFAYDLCVSRITAMERDALDLSSWRTAFNGAEPVRAGTLERFAAFFEPCGFRRSSFFPCYGLAEATLLVAASNESRGPVIKRVEKKALEHNRVIERAEDDTGALTLVGCGKEQPGQHIFIVNPESLKRCADGEIGEIWVGGPSVTSGYWNNADETARMFDAYLDDEGGGPFLRTGDLGFLDRGELFITGRIKDLIIIRGRNLYPQDIERVMEESHQALRRGCGAAFSFVSGEEEKLALMQEADTRARADHSEMIESIRRAVAEEFEVQPAAILLVKAGSVPKTSSGKLQRRACREMFLSNDFKALYDWRAPATELESRVRESPAPAEARQSDETITQCLKAELAARLGREEATIDAEQPLTSYGLDSLLAVEMTHFIESRFGVFLPAVGILQGQSIAELAHLIRQHSNDAGNGDGISDLAPDGARTYPLSHGQQALWFLHRMTPESAAYNIAAAVRIHGRLDTDALRNSFQSLVERHDALRTTFELCEGVPVQRVHAEARVSFEETDASTWSEAVLRAYLNESAHRPFDLATGPLLRIELLARAGEEHVLLLAAHHIVVDFWSLAVLVHEMGALYEARLRQVDAPLAPLPLSYEAYVRAQAKRLAGPGRERLREFWERSLGPSLPPPLVLPTDRPRPPAQTFRGDAVPINLDATLTRRLKELAGGAGATLYMTLLAAFQILLARYSGQFDFAVGTPSAGRHTASLTRLVGYFVNPLTMRADLSGDPRFVDLLARVRRTALDAFEHQEYPFPLLVQKLQPERDPSRSPLFQVMFSWQQTHLLREQGFTAFALGQPGAQLRLGELSLESLEMPQRVALFDLRLSMTEARRVLGGSLEYNTDLFDGETIRRLARHFENLLESIVSDPRQRLSELSLMDDEERRRMIIEWNDTAVDYSVRPALHRLVEAQVERTPDAIALRYEGAQLTYAELNRRANVLAYELQRRGVGPDMPVAVCLERSFELVVALLGVLKAGGAYLPLDPAYPPERLRFMLADACPPVLLTEQRLLTSLPPHAAQVVTLDDRTWRVASRAENENLTFDIAGDNLAYIIYTSGSTGRPKGAMNTHRAIVNRLLWMQQTYGLTAADRVLQKTPFSFDVSVWEFFWPLLVGAPLVLARPGGHQDPAYLAELIERERITTLHFVPSMLQVFLSRAEMSRCASLRRVICSGEALTYDLQKRFHQALDADLHNLYGPTEAAVDVTYWECEREGGRQVVPVGRPIANTGIYILDGLLRPVPVGVAGELHIGGCGLARGYLNRPELTAERFVPDPLSGVRGARLYRTGDSARYLADGEIEYLGRLDSQVKVRGFRIELGEIESVLTEHEAVRDCLVTAHADQSGDTRLTIYFLREAEAAASVDELRAFLRVRLPEYMIPSFFVSLEAWPLLPNGKVDRGALPAPSSLGSEETFVAPRDQIEDLLTAAFAAVLGVERVGIHDNFFDLGGHSLLATQIISRIRESFRVELPLRQVFRAPTVAGLAEVLHGLLGNASDSLSRIEPVERDGHLPLSFGQQRLWFLDQLEPGNAAYNIPVALRLKGPLDAPALEQSLREIIHRHEPLRTTFVDLDGKPAQLITPPGPWDLPLTDLSEVAEEEREAQARRLMSDDARQSFDLARGPLLRARLLRLSADNHVLLLSMHHIISDGWSIGILVRELGALYEAFSRGEPSPLPPLPIQHADYAAWQRRRLAEGTALAEQLDYWKRQLGGNLPALELPSDKPPLPTPSYAGATEPWRLPAELSVRLKALSLKHNVTLYMTLLAAFQTLLSRYTGLVDVSVGTPVAGRLRVETEGLIGFFVNTLVMRGDLGGDPSFVELLERTRETTLEAHAHQDIPFEMLVEELQPARDPSHTPLFQVMLVLQNAPLPALEMGALSVEQVETQVGTAKFDLILFLRESDAGLIGSWEYNTDRFDHTTIRRMTGHFETLLGGIASDPLQKLSDLPMLTEDERRQLLIEWNDTAAAYPSGLCLQHLFEARAAKTPHAIALLFGSEYCTYDELNRRVNHLAHYLRARGVGPEVLVGVMMERSIELVVALLGVLKAGGAYVPLDHTYPPERLRFMLADSAAPLLLTQQRLRAQLPAQLGAQVVCLDAEWTSIARTSAENPPPHPASVGPENLAYVIYTSGSTGRPKGVAIEHRSAVVLLLWALATFDQEQLAGVLASTSISFDLSVFEFFAPLSCGGKVILADDALHLPSLDAASEVTLVNTVPSAMTELVRMGALPTSVRTVNLAGEPLPARLARQLYEHRHVEKVYNLYGPSEDTTYSTYSLVERDGDGPPSIGRPVANTQVYLLDRQLRPVPIGVAGELYLGGSGLARGYLKRAELTAERFIPDAFGGEVGARLYRTGDLARYSADGELRFLGRIDTQVKIRGFRIELGEIESVLGAHTEVQELIVVARREAGDEQRLVAYVVARPGTAPLQGELRRHLKESLPEYMIPSAFVLLDKLPLTPNGKIDRRALPEPETRPDEAESGYVAPRTPVEEEVAHIWSRLLGVERVGIHDNFFDLGGHSLLATRVVSRVRATFRAELPLRSLFETPTVACLSERIEAMRRTADTLALPSASTRDGDGARDAAPNAALEGADLFERITMFRQAIDEMVLPPILPVARGGALPLSFAQQRLWFLNQLEPDSAAYNIVGGMRLEGALDVSALESAIQEIVCRHESLRTTFGIVDGRPVQLIAPAQPVALTLLDLRVLAASEREERVRTTADDELRRPFDLSRGPLLRISLLRLDEEEHVALASMHHIISDGWSADIFIREVVALYESCREGRPSPLAELPIQYADYAVWQREWLRGEALETRLDFWKRVLGGTLPVSALPTDYARPAKPTLSGAKLFCRLPGDLHESLNAFSRREGATLYMTLLTAFLTLLHRYTRADDVVVGTAIAGRNRAEVEELIGVFINMLVLRADLSGDPPFRKLLGRVREVALGAYAHQDLPFEKLVEELQPARALAQTPLFQIAFGLQNAPVRAFHLPGLTFSPLNFSTDIARYDLTLWMLEAEGELTASWTYSTELFKPETVERIQGHFETLLRSILSDPEARLSALEMLTADEQSARATSEREREEAQALKLASVKRRAVRPLPGAAIKTGDGPQ